MAGGDALRPHAPPRAAPSRPTARRLDCPAFHLPGALVKRHRALLTAAAGGLRPSERFQSVMAARRAHIEAEAGTSAYNLLHLRVESDWLALCEWWQKPAEGRDNCMNNTDTVGEQLQKHGFETEVRGAGCGVAVLVFCECLLSGAAWQLGTGRRPAWHPAMHNAQHTHHALARCGAHAHHHPVQPFPTSFFAPAVLCSYTCPPFQTTSPTSRTPLPCPAAAAATQVPLVVATSFPDAVPEALSTALDSIRSSEYGSVILGSDFAEAGQEAELSREEGALVRRRAHARTRAAGVRGSVGDWIAAGAGRRRAGRGQGGRCGRIGCPLGCGAKGQPLLLPTSAAAARVCMPAGGLLPSVRGGQVHWQQCVNIQRFRHSGAAVAGQVRAAAVGSSAG